MAGSGIRTYIVAILILDQGVQTHVELLQDGGLCRFVAMLKHTLNDTTAIRVSCQALDLAFECLEDELDVVSGHSFDGFLHHVVAVLILHAFQDIPIDFFDQSGLLFRENMFESLIVVSTSV